MESRYADIKSPSSDFDCGICPSLMVEPSRAPCGHKFCLTCLEEIFIYRSACPMCRSEIPEDFKLEIDLKLQAKIFDLNPDVFLQRKDDIDKFRYQNDKKFKLKLVYGNDHEELDKSLGQNCHDWCAYVRLANKNDDISKYISKVTFELHPTFPNPKRVKTKAPFELRSRGWGTFEIPITIEWNPVLGLKNTTVEHMLSFAENGDRSTFEVIVDKTLLK